MSRTETASVPDQPDHPKRAEKDQLFESALRKAREGDRIAARELLEQAQQLAPNDRTIGEMLRVMRRHSSPAPDGSVPPEPRCPADHCSPRPTEPHDMAAPASSTPHAPPHVACAVGATEVPQAAPSPEDPPGAQGPPPQPDSVAVAESGKPKLRERFAHLLTRTAARPKLAVASWRAYRATPLPRVHVERAVHYHRDKARAHRLDIYRIESLSAAAPAVLLFDAPGFPHRLGQAPKLAASFAQRAFLALHVRYRALPSYPFPAALFDCALAYRWFLDRAASLGASPHHVVVGGDAFSANLALALSIVCCHPRQERWAWELFERASPPRALLSFAGFLQTSAPERLSLGQDDGAHRLRALQSFSARYLQVDRRLPADAKLLADPLLLLEHVDRLAQPLPQCFAVVGEEDLVVPDTQRLESVYRKHHAVCCARYLPGRLVGRRSAGGLMAEPWVEEMHRFLGKDT